MSDGPLRRAWDFYLDDMMLFCARVMEFTRDLDQAGFVNNAMCFDATVRNVELTGEAATHIPEDIRAAFPDVPWRMVIATRNRLIHGYLGIDNDTLWSIVSVDIPALFPQLKEMKAKILDGGS